MNTSTRRRAELFVAVPATALAVIGLTVGGTGVANAGTLPSNGPTVAMTISDDTDVPMVLQGSSNPYGQWIQGPASYVAPHSSEIVTAHSDDPRGIGVDATYSIPGADAVFSAGNYSPGGPNVDGTRVDGNVGHTYGISSWIETGYPNMNAGYHLYGQP